jgi:hypothetical protein
MEVIKRDIEYKSRKNTFTLWPLGDPHFGSPNCDEDRFERTVAEIHQDPFALWAGIGDMADCITPNDKRFDMKCLAPWVDKDDIVESQRRRIVEVLKPIAGKCLCYLSGNHEETIHNVHQNNISKHICDDLGLPYGAFSSFIAINFKRLVATGAPSTTQVIVHARHGSGAAQQEGARIMTLMRLVNAFTADIYLMGHLHCIASYCPERLEMDKAYKIRNKRLVAVLTGSWLKAYQQGSGISYAEIKGYKPTQLGCPRIIIDPDADPDKRFSVIT